MRKTGIGLIGYLGWAMGCILPLGLAGLIACAAPTVNPPRGVSVENYCADKGVELYLDGANVRTKLKDPTASEEANWACHAYNALHTFGQDQ
jgi:hypothetical protein